MTAASMRRSPARESGGSCSASAIAAVSVPPQVRKSLVVNASPALVEHCAGQERRLSGAVEPDEPRAARIPQKRLHRVRESRIDDRAVDQNAMLAVKTERHSVPPDGRVALSEGGHTVRASLARVSLGADAEPGAVHEGEPHGTRPLGLVRAEPEVLDHLLSQRRQPLAEAHEPIELLLLPRCAVGRVVQVLTPPGGVDAGRL